MKIRIKYHGIVELIQHGNWIDLSSTDTYEFHAPKIITDVNGNNIVKFDTQMINLGISLDLPKHFEANIVPRSSLLKKQGLIQGNHFGVIDGGTNKSIGIECSDKVGQGYTGNDDIWYFPAIALQATKILPNQPICQFSIRPSMNAPIWTKLKWLFTSKIKFIEVDNLNSNNRGGFGTSDKK